MKNLILTAALAAMTALPSIAGAQTSAAPMVCMSPKAGETANATMGASQLVCHQVDVAKVQAATKTLMSMMDTKMLSAEQMQHMKAAQATINQSLHFAAVPGTNGNPNN